MKFFFSSEKNHIIRTKVFLVLINFVQLAVAQNDSIGNVVLEQIFIQPERVGPVVGHLSGHLDISTVEIEHAPRVLGFADPIRYLQSLPGVQSTSELQGGLFVDGTGNSHTLVTLGNAPIYNPSHLLGVFSMFNSLHFSGMSLSKQASGTVGRLGGVVEMKSDTLHTDKVKFRTELGIIGSQANVRIPIMESSMLSVSARLIYFNFISEHYLSKFWEDNSIGYSFNDCNVTWSSKFKSSDALQINYFSGSDKALFDVNGSNLDMRMNWRNSVFSASWNHRINKGQLTQSIFRSSYYCRFNARMENRNLFLPGGLTDYSYKLDGHTIQSNGLFRFGVRLSHYVFEEQNPMLTDDMRTSFRPDNGINSNNVCANILYDWNIRGNNLLELSVTGHYFSSKNDGSWTGKSFIGVDPAVSFSHTFSNDYGILGLRVGTARQYLHVCGFTTNGMPTEFWLPSGEMASPESSASITVSYERDLFDGSLNFQSDVYCKALRGTIELDNSMINALNDDYSLWDNIIQGNGYAYGVNLMIGNSNGALDWMVSYSYGRSFAKSDKYNTYSPCFFERPHDLKFRLGWDMNRNWRFDATGMVCSGTPFTMPKYVYVLNENIIVEYGEHNGARMPTNWRVDLSAGWTLAHTDMLDYGFDFALYNAFCANNVLFYFFSKRLKSDTYLMKRFMPMPVCLPSVSFHINF